jgi:hypothetical protein
MLTSKRHSRVLNSLVHDFLHAIALGDRPVGAALLLRLISIIYAPQVPAQDPRGDIFAPKQQIDQRQGRSGAAQTG